MDEKVAVFLFTNRICAFNSINYNFHGKPFYWGGLQTLHGV